MATRNRPLAHVAVNLLSGAARLVRSPAGLATALAIVIGAVGCSQAIGTIDDGSDQSSGDAAPTGDKPPPSGDDGGTTPPTDDGGTTPPVGDDSGTTPPSDDGGGTTPPATDSGTTPPPTDTGTTPPPVDSGTPTDPTTGLALVQDLSIQEIAIFQGVKVSLEKSGSKTTSRRAPVIPGRPGLLRVYVAPSGGYSPREVTAVLTLTTSGSPSVITTKATISSASSDGSLSSTFNFDLPGSAIGDGTTYSVALKSSTAGSGSPAQYPSSGQESLDTLSTGDVLKIKLVPVRYNADGSGRLPDTSASQIAAYTAMMMKIYPAKKVDITVRAPYDYSNSISASGSGWSQILQSIVDLRNSDGAAADVYYFGAFAPASSFGSFCGGGCVTGLSGVLTSSTDTFGRASVGIGFTGSMSTETMAHEIGHAHGRQHADCGGASGVDPAFPYSGAGIGVYGYDILGKTLMSTGTYTDLMGYCNPVWISDYTFGALANRLHAVNSHAMIYRPSAAPTRWQFVSVGGDGKLSWGKQLTLTDPPIAEPHTLTYVSPDGSVVETATGQYYPFNDLPGGYMLVPLPSVDFSTMHVGGFAGVSKLAKAAL